MNENRKPSGQNTGNYSLGYLRKTDAAVYLGISPRTLSNWMRMRIVAYVKPARRVLLFRKNDLDAAMERFRVRAAGE